MKTHLNRIGALAVLISTPMFTLSAQDGGRPGGAGEMLKRADADGDGKVSKDEFVKARTAEIDEQFARIDGNGDGFIDTPEVEAIAGKLRAAAGERGKGGPPPGRGDGFRPAPPAGDADGERPKEGPRDGEGPRRGPPDGGFQPGAGGPPPEIMEQMFGRMDVDSSGSLSKEEFITGMAKMREMMSKRGGEGMMRRPEGGPPGGPGEGFRRPPQQGGDTGKPRPELEEGA